MLRYKDVCKRDMMYAEINPDLWEAAAADRSNWRRVVRTGVKRAEAKREQRVARQRGTTKSKSNFRTVATTGVHRQRLSDRDCNTSTDLESQSTPPQYRVLTFLAQSVVFRDRRRILS